MKQKHHYSWISGLVWVSVLFLSSCLVERDTWEDGGEQPEGEEIVFSLRMPVQGATTRALTDTDENKIIHVNVLAFDPENQIYVQNSYTDKIEDDVDLKTKSIYARLKKGHFDLVVLANAQTDIFRKAFPSDNDLEGLTKKEVTDKLILEYTGAWIDASGKPLRTFPMWGYRDRVRVGEDDLTGQHAIQMSRMVVRVDVEIEGDQAKNVFTMNEVYLYNSYTKGSLVHAGQGWDSVNYKAKLPSLPGSSGPFEGPVAYTKDALSPITTTGIASEGMIYTLETPAGNETNLLDATCLVIGGVYDGKQNYYRVDFVDVDEDGDSFFIPLLRNHHYKVGISEVNGEGFPDPDQAFRKGASNMELSILAWNESGMNDITFGSRYQLVVNTDSMYFYSNGRKQFLNIYTDHPSGWKIENVTDLDWVTIDLFSGNTKESTEVGIQAQELKEESGIENRKGYFYIRAGNLRKKIIVYQSLLEELYLEVSPTSLSFNHSGLSTKSIQVEVLPEDLTVYITELGSVAWASGGFPETGLPAKKTYNFRPAENTTGRDLLTQVTFMVTDGKGRSTTRDVLIFQSKEVENDRFTVTWQHPKYPSAGGTGLYFDVASDYAWNIDASGITPAGILTPVSTGEQSAGNVRYYFQLAENNRYQERTITMPVLPSDPEIDPFVIRLVQDYDKPWFSLPTIFDLGAIVKGVNDQAQTLNISSLNSSWSYTVGVGSEKVYTAISPAPSQTHTGGTPNHPVTQGIQITPVSYEPVAGTPVAGQEHSTTLTITTLGHDPADAHSQTITLKTKVPEFLDASNIKVRKSDSPAGVLVTPGELVARPEHTVYIEIPSNTSWTGRSNLTDVPDVVHAATEWGVHREPLVISGNNKRIYSWDIRDVIISYIHNGEEKEIIRYQQKPYELYKITPPASISGQHMQYVGYREKAIDIFVAEGDFPARNVFLRIKEAPIGRPSTSATDVLPGETVEIPLIIWYFNNTGREREVTIQYACAMNESNPSFSTWYDLCKITQKRGNPILSNGVSVAIADAGEEISWAEAMGIDDRYNTEMFTVGADGNYTATRKTGCEAYSEGPYGPGEWRVPTLEETTEIKRLGLVENGGFNGSDNIIRRLEFHHPDYPDWDHYAYWTSTQLNATTVRGDRFATVAPWLEEYLHPTFDMTKSHLRFQVRSDAGDNLYYPSRLRCVSKRKNIDTW